MLGDVSGLRVLDLFCGTGALGIEALSRGAAHATLVDTRTEAARRNVEELGIAGRAQVVGSDAVRFLRRAPEAAFDLVLCDPPYRLADRFAQELDPLIRSRVAAGGRVVAETAPGRPLALSLALETERAYGDTLIRIHRAEESR
jgi:16S rRNA (guanine966-N2)-methyltransferase